jgi:hypothetical protein
MLAIEAVMQRRPISRVLSAKPELQACRSFAFIRGLGYTSAAGAFILMLRPFQTPKLWAVFEVPAALPQDMQDDPMCCAQSIALPPTSREIFVRSSPDGGAKELVHGCI